MTKIKNFDDFLKESYMPNNSYNVTAKATFKLTDLMDNEFVIFNDEQTDEDVKRIYEYLVKSMAKDESGETTINVYADKNYNDLTFELQLHGDKNDIFNEFKTNLENIVNGIANNAYCVVELKDSDVKKFFKKYTKNL